MFTGEGIKLDLLVEGNSTQGGVSPDDEFPLSEQALFVGEGVEVDLLASEGVELDLLVAGNSGHGYEERRETAWSVCSDTFGLSRRVTGWILRVLERTER